LGIFQKNLIKPNSEDQKAALDAFVKAERELILEGLYPKQHLSVPDFVCIGAQKAGTTWLYRNLKNHPEVSLKQKEFHYFDAYHDQPAFVYSKCFSVRGKRIAGDITPSYCLIPEEQVAFMHALMPDVKLIFLLRNPIERAWSGLLMHFFKRKDTAEVALTEKKMINYLNKPAVVDRGFYTKSIDRFRKFYSQEQMLILDFDRISNEPISVLEEVFGHIGVSTNHGELNFDPTRKIHTRAKELEMPKAIGKMLAELYQPEIEALNAVYPQIAGKWLDSLSQYCG
jgi:hypothetical protein